jgi:hypothetical protein
MNTNQFLPPGTQFCGAFCYCEKVGLRVNDQFHEVFIDTGTQGASMNP